MASLDDILRRCDSFEKRDPKSYGAIRVAGDLYFRIERVQRGRRGSWK